MGCQIKVQEVRVELYLQVHLKEQTWQKSIKSQSFVKFTLSSFRFCIDRRKRPTDARDRALRSFEIFSKMYPFALESESGFCEIPGTKKFDFQKNRKLRRTLSRESVDLFRRSIQILKGLNVNFTKLFYFILFCHVCPFKCTCKYSPIQTSRTSIWHLIKIGHVCLQKTKNPKRLYEIAPNLLQTLS